MYIRNGARFRLERQPWSLSCLLAGLRCCLARRKERASTLASSQKLESHKAQTQKRASQGLTPEPETCQIPSRKLALEPETREKTRTGTLHMASLLGKFLVQARGFWLTLPSFQLAGSQISGSSVGQVSGSLSQASASCVWLAGSPSGQGGGADASRFPVWCRCKMPPLGPQCSTSGVGPPMSVPPSSVSHDNR